MPIELESLAMLIVLSSPSGGGKSSVCRALLESDPKLEYSVSVTSRPPRPGEVNGRDYWFVSEEEFHRLVSEGAFYEWAQVHGNYYGTRRDLIEARLAEKKDVVLDLDVVGGLNVKKLNDRAVLIYILPPSMKVLEERLRSRATDSEAEIQKRLRNAVHEINFAEKYDYVVINDDLPQTIATIRKIIAAERHSSRHQRVKITPDEIV
ncbi:MAG: guanylate kinase [Candidatus Hydrogenedentota bacterium]|jgi:guanylate kinase|uniref:Guanylate kinase n=1 Tax=Sumerlaea chitinivorans TaxID=2250252 RepID=A0A2Z4Y3M7_SUMC1|nr:Guanylate kinase [Candidatus Sumerlaea chitinivorans]RMH27354.1 MAG: guanylate kinase [Candidatus Hydrogenedentota bacterium]GIX44594.1 MAG: guanylate kinase [Candidatus Sumerlaea sp.]